MYERCAGLDIGKDEVTACVRTPGESGAPQPGQAIRVLGHRRAVHGERHAARERQRSRSTQVDPRGEGAPVLTARSNTMAVGLKR